MILPLALTIIAGLALPDDSIHLNPVPKGGTAKVGGYYMPQRANFSADKPAAITKAPADLAAPMYGTLPIGEKPVAFIIDEPDGKPAHLYIDTNGNGDLTDDPATEWTGKENKQGEKTTTMYAGSAQVDIGTKEKPFLVSVSMYRFDKTDSNRAALKSTLLYYRDYAYEGEVTIGDRKIKAVLVDELARGDFRPKAGDAKSGVNFLIDINGNGRFDARGESFDAAQPFNVDGVTWEIADMARDGSSFRIVKSEKTVAAVEIPPDTSVGKPLASFQATDTEGKAVKFPDDYKGKIVLVDFWATWCGPCMAEMPNVVKAYGKYHEAGFEILGISLDNEQSVKKMPDVMQKAGMTWRQVADGKGWKAEIAQKFAISSIPATFLVDGTTGKIIGANLRGEALDKAVEKALADGKKTSMK